MSGVTRIINIGLLEDEDLQPGDWVLIHVGFAMSKIDEEEAALALASLQLMGQAYDDELEAFWSSKIASESSTEGGMKMGVIIGVVVGYALGQPGRVGGVARARGGLEDHRHLGRGAGPRRRWALHRPGTSWSAGPRSSPGVLGLSDPTAKLRQAA